MREDSENKAEKSGGANLSSAVLAEPGLRIRRILAAAARRILGAVFVVLSVGLLFELVAFNWEYIKAYLGLRALLLIAILISCALIYRALRATTFFVWHLVSAIALVVSGILLGVLRWEPVLPIRLWDVILTFLIGLVIWVVPKRRTRLRTREEGLGIIPEAPIRTLQEDMFGWREFAEKTAEMLVLYRARQSLTIGIQGRWGQGKTSMMNMLHEALGNEHRDTQGNLIQPLVIEFNPWYYDDKGSLIAGLSRSLADALVCRGGNLALKWRLSGYAKEVVQVLKGSSLNEVRALGELLVPGLALLPEPSKRLDDLKALIEHEIEETLQEDKMIVLIDDLDRCNKEEIVTLFRVLRFFLSFDSIIFIIAYDKTHLKTIFGSEWDKELLDKFVQLEFGVPPADVLALLDKRNQGNLQNSFPALADRHWDRIREFRAYIATTPRQVKLFLNRISLLKTLTERSVDIYFDDLLLLHIVQTGFPSVYSHLKRNPVLISECTRYLELQSDEVVEESNREAIKDKLGLEESEYEPIERVLRHWAQNHRDLIVGETKGASICRPEATRLYFMLTRPEYEVEISDFEQWFQGLVDIDDPDARKKHFDRRLNEELAQQREPDFLIHCIDALDTKKDLRAVPPLVETGKSYLTAKHVEKLCTWLSEAVAVTVMESEKGYSREMELEDLKKAARSAIADVHIRHLFVVGEHLVKKGGGAIPGLVEAWDLRLIEAAHSGHIPLQEIVLELPRIVRIGRKNVRVIIDDILKNMDHFGDPESVLNLLTQGIREMDANVCTHAREWLLILARTLDAPKIIGRIQTVGARRRNGHFEIVVRALRNSLYDAIAKTVIAAVEGEEHRVPFEDLGRDMVKGKDVIIGDAKQSAALLFQLVRDRGELSECNAQLVEISVNGLGARNYLLQFPQQEKDCQNLLETSRMRAHEWQKAIESFPWKAGKKKGENACILEGMWRVTQEKGPGGGA